MYSFWNKAHITKTNAATATIRVADLLEALGDYIAILKQAYDEHVVPISRTDLDRTEVPENRIRRTIIRKDPPPILLALRACHVVCSEAKYRAARATASHAKHAHGHHDGDKAKNENQDEDISFDVFVHMYAHLSGLATQMRQNTPVHGFKYLWDVQANQWRSIPIGLWRACQVALMDDEDNNNDNDNNDNNDHSNNQDVHHRQLEPRQVHKI
jgi:hypothetical protein